MVSITLTSEQLADIDRQRAGQTQQPQQPQVPDTPVDIQPPAKPYVPPAQPQTPAAGAEFIGDLKFDGERLFSSNFGPNMIAYARLVIPPDAKHGSNGISIAEFNDGASSSRAAWVTKGALENRDAAAAFVRDTSPSFAYIVGDGPGASGAVRMQPGETWYVCVANERPFEPFAPSVKVGQTANILIKCYPPV